MIWVLPLPILGRLAGTGLQPFNWASPLIGVCLGLILGVQDWTLILFAMAGWAAEKPSPQHDIFWKQILRGLFAGGCYLPLAYYTTPVLILIPAYAVSWPLAAYIGRHTTLSFWIVNDRIERAEFLRHTLAGAVLCIFTKIL